MQLTCLYMWCLVRVWWEGAPSLVARAVVVDGIDMSCACVVGGRLTFSSLRHFDTHRLLPSFRFFFAPTQGPWNALTIPIVFVGATLTSPINLAFGNMLAPIFGAPALALAFVFVTWICLGAMYGWANFDLNPAALNYHNPGPKPPIVTFNVNEVFQVGSAERERERERERGSERERSDGVFAPAGMDAWMRLHLLCRDSVVWSDADRCHVLLLSYLRCGHRHRHRHRPRRHVNTD
jgi:hypothetical protein